MCVDLIDQHNARAIDKVVAGIVAHHDVGTVYADHMPKNVNQHRERRPIAVAHVGEWKRATGSVLHQYSVCCNALDGYATV